MIEEWEMRMIKIPKEIYISPKERQKIIDNLRTIITVNELK